MSRLLFPLSRVGLPLAADPQWALVKVEDADEVAANAVLEPEWAFAASTAFVYTWVNGSDPAYREQRRTYGGAGAVGTSRDRDSGELRYSLRALARYLPWSRGPIYLVAPRGQVPSWMNASHPRIHIVAQESLFPRQEDLPTFSSNAIEQHLWRIPGLTSTFVHLNDDYFFGAPVAPAHLFTPHGGSRLFFETSTIRGGREQALAYEKDNAKVWLASTLNTHVLLTDAYGPATRHYLKHAPFVYQVAAMRRAHERWPEQLQATSSHRFRHWRDIITPLLHHYLLVHEGDALGLEHEIASADEMKLHTAFAIINDRATANTEILRRIRTGNAPRFYTLNDGFTRPEIGDLIAKTLADALPHPSEFEL